MKKVIFFILLGFISTALFAQTARNTMVSFNKEKVPGINIAVTNCDLATVQEALKERLERIGGLKGVNASGFRLYTDQIFPDFGSVKYDIYLKADANKKTNDVVITLMVSSGNSNFVSQESNPELNQKMIDLLTQFANRYLVEFSANKKFNAQSAELGKLEKEYTKLVSERDKLSKSLEAKESAVNSKAQQIATIKASLNALPR
jgi:hypothetical protein